MIHPSVLAIADRIGAGPPVEIGRCYQHPEHGPIRIVSGQYWGTYGLSNFWHWVELETGAERCGYAGRWPELEEER